MPNTPSQSQDEFADLPDIVDFSIIRTEEHIGNVSADLLDEFAQYDSYNEHDPYEDIDFDAVPELGAHRQNTADQHNDTRTQRADTQSQMPSDTSTQYSFEELDDAALNELHDIEMRDTRVHAERLTGEASTATPAPSSRRTVSRTSTTTHSACHSSSSMKRKRSDVTTPASKKLKTKGKPSQDLYASARQLLSSMEESVSCSICYEIFSEPHVSTPCGHSFCAECVVDWMKKTVRSAPQCPLCRTPLTQGSLVAPNFALKNAIEKYVAALAESGFVDWQTQGQKYIEWTGRNARWPKVAPVLRDLQSRRWDELDEPSQDPVQLVAAQQQLGDVSDGESSDEDRSSSDEIYWAPTPPRRSRT